MKKIFFYLFIITSISLYAQEKNNQQNQFSMPAISITIGGKFIVNGTYPAMLSERVDQFITRVYNLAKENILTASKDVQTSQNITQSLDQEYALRGIILKNSNGDERIIDLAKFRINGDFKNNPYLKNDDVIIFPAVDLDRNFVRVLGAVNNPITFMFVDGDKLSDALEFAQGINKAYENVSEATIYRLSYDGEKFDSLKVNLDQDIELKRGDRIRVVANETKRRDYFVNVIGEVNSPGSIPITKTTTTIREIINRAGGFTPNADISRAEIIRGANAFESLVFSEDLEKLLMLRMSTLVENDSLYFLIDEKLRFMRGNGLVDFTKIFNDSLSDGNFIVQNYDAIYIPPKIDLVYVYGQVNRAGYLKYFPNKNYQYYLDQAGGIGESAVDVYIVKGQSRSWIAAEENPNVNVEPGDYIWVSKKTPRTFWYHVQQAGQIASILGAVATVILLFVQVGK